MSTRKYHKNPKNLLSSYFSRPLKDLKLLESHSGVMLQFFDESFLYFLTPSHSLIAIWYRDGLNPDNARDAYNGVLVVQERSF